MSKLNKEKFITITSNKRKIVLSAGSILYVVMSGKNAEIHISDGKIYQTRKGIGELEKELGDSFIKVHRGCIVSVMAIHNITDNINLSNGESLMYATRKKKDIIDQFHEKQKRIINGFYHDGTPKTDEEYCWRYSSFKKMPFAFADIELIFDDEKHAIDWIFRYGNPALAAIEEVPLENLIGNSYKALFPDSDSKWIRSYERATLYGEMLEIIDYLPRINRYLKVICFPTFKGHCGCIIFDISKIKFTKGSEDTEKALMLYLGNLLNKNN